MMGQNIQKAALSIVTYGLLDDPERKGQWGLNVYIRIREMRKNFLEAPPDCE